MKKWCAYFCLALFVLPEHVLAYKFLCNGIDADGLIEADECGSCSDETGPRWLPSSVDVYVDVQVRPGHISEGDWRRIVTSSLNAWNNVPGANLRINFAGTSRQRGFGAYASLHEIFWVLDRKEWRQKVGSGENGTLGVTLSPYHCPSSDSMAREIYDADLIMNGVKKFNWQINCAGQTQCEAIGATLTHEIGHFIGIGHPCASCDWSVMSALADSNLDRPVFDDQEALRALYPSEMGGQIGTRCENQKDCNVGLNCIKQNNTKFCSMECSTVTCPRGFACGRKSNQSFCLFASGRLAQAAGLRERCETRSCQDGLQCVETFTNKSFCVAACLQKSDCPKIEECVLFPDGGAGVCLQSVGQNELCGEFTTCAKDLVCVGKSESQGICKIACDPDKKRQCRSGEVCTLIGSELAACLDAKFATNFESLIGSSESFDNFGAHADRQDDGESPQGFSKIHRLEEGCSCSSTGSEPKYGFVGLLGIVIALFLGYVGLPTASKN